MTDLTFLCQVSSEWLISQLEITSEIYWNIFLDIQDSLQNAEYFSEVKLNTNETRTWVEHDILSQIQQTWLTIFSHLSNSSAKKCLWHMSLHVQIQACCFRMSQSSIMMRTSVWNLSTVTASDASSINTTIAFNDLMISLLLMNGRTVMKIRVQDLCSDNNSILKNASYFLLIQITKKNLDFEQDNHLIVFIDTDDISYVVWNDRNLKTALQSVLQSTQQHQQVSKLHIQARFSR